MGRGGLMGLSNVDEFCRELGRNNVDVGSGLKVYLTL